MKKQCLLAQKTCIPCHGGIPPLEGEQINKLLLELDRSWRVIDEHHLEKTYLFQDFVSALTFTNKVGALAEELHHHPDIMLTYGKVVIKVWTHKINGLAESDFILAARIDLI